MQAKRRQIASCRLTMQNKIEIYVYKSLGKIGKNNVSNVKFEKDEDKGYCAISEKKYGLIHKRRFILSNLFKRKSSFV